MNVAQHLQGVTIGANTFKTESGETYFHELAFCALYEVRKLDERTKRQLDICGNRLKAYYSFLLPEENEIKFSQGDWERLKAVNYTLPGRRNIFLGDLPYSALPGIINHWKHVTTRFYAYGGLHCLVLSQLLGVEVRNAERLLPSMAENTRSNPIFRNGANRVRYETPSAAYSLAVMLEIEHFTDVKPTTCDRSTETTFTLSPDVSSDSGDSDSDDDDNDARTDYVIDDDDDALFERIGEDEIDLAGTWRNPSKVRKEENKQNKNKNKQKLNKKNKN